jgi:phospholipase C
MLGFSGITGTDAVTGAPTRINGLISPEITLRQYATAARVTTAGALVAAKGWRWPPASPLSIRHLITSNTFNGQDYSVTQRADYAIPLDPGHEFTADSASGYVTGVVQQLCGPAAVYASEGAYPPIVNSGFAASYAAVALNQKIASDPSEIMKCYDTPNQLPVLNQLAQEFVVCDNWYSSLPGPT